MLVAAVGLGQLTKTITVLASCLRTPKRSRSVVEVSCSLFFVFYSGCDFHMLGLHNLFDPSEIDFCMMQKPHK